MGPLIRIGKRFICISIAFIACASIAFSETLFCTPTAVPPIVRSEGITERVGDIVLDCSGGAPGAVVQGNLTVFLNVNVTNKLLNDNSTDALLTVDTGSGPVPANVSGAPFGSTAVVFNGLAFTVPASGHVTLRITNLRGNASQLGQTPQQSIFAFVAFNQGSSLVTTNPQFTVAVTEPGLLADFSSKTVTCRGSALPSAINLANLFAAGTTFFSTRVSEGFATAFEPKDTFSDTGTRIMVQYSGFPAGAQLYVPDFVAGSSAIQRTAGGDLGVPASGGEYAPSVNGSLLLIRVVGADSNGAGGTLAYPVPAVDTTFNSVSAVPLTNGAGNAVYEVVNSNAIVQESAQFPTFLGLAPFGTGSSTTANMSVTFAPLSTVTTVAAAPVPRFVNVSPPLDCSAENDCSASYFPHLDVATTPLTFTAPPGQTRYVQIHNDGGGELDWTATITFATGSGWLTVEPASGTNNATIRLDVQPGNVSPGVYQATLTVDAGPLAGSRSIPVTFAVTSTAPAVSAIVNAASFQAGALAPGSLATITGSGLSGSLVNVTFNGVPAKLLYSSPTQINLEIPPELSGSTSAQVVVTVDGVSSAAQTVTLAAVAPAVFTNGVLNQDNTVNSATNPAARGSVIQIFATGLASPASGTITARVSGMIIASPYYAGPAPGIVGVQQVNLVIPDSLPATPAQLMVCALGSDPHQPVCSLPVSVALK